jgi:membrane-associated protein
MNISHFFSLILHIDHSLALLIQNYGVWIYAILFFIIFAETGLIVFPFLPGDSLLFLIGAFCATNQMNLTYALLGLFLSAVLGNTCNYYIGRWLGQKVYEKNYRLIDRQHLLKTQAFFAKHGGKTIVFARFLPIFRTFAPFVAGVSKMNGALFQLYNNVSAVLWVGGFIILGYFFGNIPFIKDNLNVIVLIGFAAAFFPLIVLVLVKKIKKQKLEQELK